MRIISVFSREIRPPQMFNSISTRKPVGNHILQRSSVELIKMRRVLKDVYLERSIKHETTGKWELHKAIK